MKTLSGIMGHTSKELYLESCRLRYPSRNRAGKSAMISEVSDTLGWDRKHTIKKPVPIRRSHERIEEDREDEIARADAAPMQNLVKTTPKNLNQTKRRVS